MSYSLRNTLILLIALFLLGGGGYGFLHFRLDPRIEKLQATLQEKQKTLTEMQNTVAGFEQLRTVLAEDTYRLQHYPKEIFPSDNHSLIYGFLNNVNQGSAYIRTNIVARETKIFDDHGVLNSDFEGTGWFSNLYRFISAIENSRPITKINRIELTAPNDVERLGEVNVSMRLESYFGLDTLTSSQNVMEITGSRVNLRTMPSTSSNVINQVVEGEQVRFLTENTNWVKVESEYGTGWLSNLFVKPVEFSSLLSVRRPQTPINGRLFYPLIHGIPPNTDGLINVEQSRLTGLTADKIFLIDQKGTLQELVIGDEVYLGSLSSINQEDDTAVFVLNKGGIVEKYEMTLDQNSGTSD